MNIHDYKITIIGVRVFLLTEIENRLKRFDSADLIRLSPPIIVMSVIVFGEENAMPVYTAEENSDRDK